VEPGKYFIKVDTDKVPFEIIAEPATVTVK